MYQEQPAQVGIKEEWGYRYNCLTAREHKQCAGEGRHNGGAHREHGMVEWGTYKEAVTKWKQMQDHHAGDLVQRRVLCPEPTMHKGRVSLSPGEDAKQEQTA